MTSVPAATSPSSGDLIGDAISNWLVIGMYTQDYGCGPNADQMNRDYLTEGANGPKTEANIVPVAGMVVNTDYNVAQSAWCDAGNGAGGRATCPPTVFQQFARNRRANFSDIFGDSNEVMSYMFCYVTNNTQANVFCRLDSGSDDSVAAILDNVPINVVRSCRGYGDHADSTLMVVTPGTHRLMLKVFEGGGGFDGGAGIRDWNTSGMLVPGTLTVSLTPPAGFVVPPNPYPARACVSAVSAAREAAGVRVTWTNNDVYGRLVIERRAVLADNWTVLADNVAGTESSFFDSNPDTAAAAVYYRVTPQYFVVEKDAFASICVSEAAGLVAPGYAVYQQGMFPTPAYDGTQDTHIIVNSPDTNQGAWDHFEEGDWNAPSGYDHKEGLLSFAIAPLANSREVQSSALGLFFDTSRSGVYNDHTVYVRQVLRQWNEGTGCCSDGPTALTGETSWNWARQNEEAWEMAGAYGSTDIQAPSPEVSAVYGAASQRWVAFGGEGLTGLVNSWLFDVYPNYGVKITQCQGSCPNDGSANSYIQVAYDLASSEFGDPTRRPILIMLVDRAPSITSLTVSSSSVELCLASVTVDLTAVVKDADRDPMTISWTTTGGTVTPQTPTTKAKATFTELGTYYVTCTVSDGELSASQDVRIDVVACTNTAPTISITPAGPVSIDLCDATVSQAFVATVDDVNAGQTLTTTWAATGGTLTVGNPTTSAAVVFDTVGEYDVTATVTDGIASTSATTHVVINACPGTPVFTGDANNSKAVDIADAVCILGYLFGPTTDACKQPKCLANMDTNDSNAVDIADAVRVLSFLFARGDMLAPDGTAMVGAAAGCKLYRDVTLPCAEPCAAK